MSEQNVAVVRGVYDAFGRGDVEAVLGAFDPEIEWNEAEGMPYGGQYVGPQAIAENVFGPITSDADDFAVTPDKFVAQGDEVVALGRYTGRGHDSGKEFDFGFAHAWTFRDGKPVRFRQYADTQVFNDALAGQPAA